VVPLRTAAASPSRSFRPAPTLWGRNVSVSVSPPTPTSRGCTPPDHVEQFTTLAKHIHERFPRLGYVHMVESRGDPAKLTFWAVQSAEHTEAETLDKFRKIFEGGQTAFFSAGGYTPAVARDVAKAHGGAVVFGRWFISSEWLGARHSSR
jgi:2,4-dienoyl-CoA reductase-like NADH-dependent reductase (Old Yellow Enzyme family)